MKKLGITMGALFVFVLAGFWIFTGQNSAHAKQTVACPAQPVNRIDVSIVSDISGSMHDPKSKDVSIDNGKFIYRDEAVKIALIGCQKTAGGAILQCPSGVSPMEGFIDKFTLANDGDRIALHTFENNGKTVLGFSTSIKDLRQKIKGNDFSATKGGTNMTDGLSKAKTEIESNGRKDNATNSPTARVVIILGDGEANGAKVARGIEKLADYQNPKTVVWGIAFGSGAKLDDLKKITTDPSKARSATSLQSLSDIYAEIANTIQKKGLDFDKDGRYPVYCVGGPVCTAKNPCTDYYNNPEDWGLDSTDKALTARFADPQASAGDLDGDGKLAYDIAPLGLTKSQLTALGLDPNNPHLGEDRDDFNKYVSPDVKEGLCKDTAGNPAICAGPLTQAAWIPQAPGTQQKQYANCTDYYADKNPDPDPSSDKDGIRCETLYGISSTQSNPFYSCFDTKKTSTRSDDTPTYLTNKRISAAGAVPINNNQTGGANAAELSCPKSGGLVSCGRYADDPATPDVDESAPCGFCSFFSLFNRILVWIMFKIAPLAVAFIIVVGGFLITLSRGNSSQLRQGKNFILWALLGYAVMLIGWMVLNSFFAGIGIKKWTGITGETGEITAAKPLGTSILLTTDKTTWNDDDLNGLTITITKDASNPQLAGESRKIIDTIDNSPKDQIETELWSVTPGSGAEFKIGGWWQFSCGISATN